MARCTFKSKYWNFDLEKEVEYKCDNNKHSKSDKCIFHDLSFLDKKENFEIVEIEFQKRIDKHISKKDKTPFFCIGYHLYELNILDRQFSNSAYFNGINILGPVTINSKFLSNVSFAGGKFSGADDVSFAAAVFSGEGSIDFTEAVFSGEGSIDFTEAVFSGGGTLISLEPNFQGEAR
jgi:uncharacterized protein YjbI with pentapeptide repeats